MNLTDQLPGTRVGIVATLGAIAISWIGLMALQDRLHRPDRPAPGWSLINWQDPASLGAEATIKVRLGTVPGLGAITLFADGADNLRMEIALNPRAKRIKAQLTGLACAVHGA